MRKADGYSMACVVICLVDVLRLCLSSWKSHGVDASLLHNTDTQNIDDNNCAPWSSANITVLRPSPCALSHRHVHQQLTC